MKKLALVLACILLALPASAEFWPLSNDGAYTLNASVRLTAKEGTTEDELALLNEALQKIALRVSVSGDTSQSAVLYDNTDFLSVYEKKTNIGTLMYMTGCDQILAGAKNPAEMLFGNMPVFSVQALDFSPIKSGLDALFEGLSDRAEEEKKSTALKNVGTATRRVNYVFTAEEAPLLWDAMRQTLWPQVYAALRGTPAWQSAAEDFILGSSLTAACTLRRLTDADGNTMGLEMTGRMILPDGSTKKLSLLCGYAEETGGVYIKLTLSPTRGSNKFSLVMTGKKTEKTKSETITYAMDFTCVQNGVTDTVSADVDIKNVKTDTENKITGTLTATVTNKTSSATKKTVYTVTPDLSFSENAGFGTVKYQQKTGSKTDITAVFDLSLSPCGALVMPAGEITDLGSMSVQEIYTLKANILSVLTQKTASILSAMGKEKMLLLTHLLRNDAWYQMTAVPVTEDCIPELQTNDEYIVKEE